MSDSPAPLPPLVATQLRLAEAAHARVPRAAAPYFVHLRLQTGPRTLDLLLGTGGPISPELALLDWETAPLAEACLTSRAGEEYEVEAAGRELSGTVLERNRVTFERGELVEVIGDAQRFRRGPDGSWRELAEVPVRLTPRPPGAGPTLTPLEVELDPSQRRVVDLAPSRSVLVRGEAGFGKTTVALRRLVRLRQLAGPHFTAAVVVPTEGLRRMTELLLERSQIAGVEVWHYDRWVVAQARRAFRRLPLRTHDETPSAVIRFKRHPALREALAHLAAHPPELVDDDGQDLRRGARVHRGDLEHLFGDQRLVESVVAASAGTLRAGDVAEVLNHTRAQFRATAREEFAHVNRDYLVTADGRDLDEGTPAEVAGSLDTEDYAVLFELDRLRALRCGERPAPLPRYDVLLLDEAQELAPLELALLGRCLGSRGTAIVAGDDAQQVDPAAGFSGWAQTMAELGQPDAASEVLELNHRCPPEVTALAQPLRTPAGVGAAQGPALVWARQPTPLHVVLWLIDALRPLQAADPESSIAVIARTAESARGWARHLQHVLPLRLSLDGRFEFRSGLIVTCVAEVKGLEFDHVVVPDASAEVYPDTPESRRALYVALTRATTQLALSAAGRGTPLVQWPEPA